jgi:hypothetical protein
MLDNFNGNRNETGPQKREQGKQGHEREWMHGKELTQGKNDPHDENRTNENDGGYEELRVVHTKSESLRRSSRFIFIATLE